MLLIIKTVVELVQISFVDLCCQFWFYCFLPIFSLSEKLENIRFLYIWCICRIVSQNFTLTRRKTYIVVFLYLIYQKSSLNRQIFWKQYFLWPTECFQRAFLGHKIFFHPIHLHNSLQISTRNYYRIITHDFCFLFCIKIRQRSFNIRQRVICVWIYWIDNILNGELAIDCIKSIIQLVLLSEVILALKSVIGEVAIFESNLGWNRDIEQNKNEKEFEKHMANYFEYL